MKVHPIILAGGVGSRLWPLSRANSPKQLLRLTGKHTMLQSTIRRIDQLTEEVIVVCSEKHKFAVAEQLQGIGRDGTIIVEPIGKNTAPSVCLALSDKEPEDLVLVLPADQHIEDEQAFIETVEFASNAAQAGYIVTFGIEPKEPNTGYGYIHRGRKNQFGYEIKSFREKPCRELALEFLDSGEYLWNAGIFMFKAGLFQEEINKYQADILDICQRAFETKISTGNFLEIDETIFSTCPENSIDYAVMENTDKGLVIPFQGAWTDLGTWDAMQSVEEKDEAGNILIGDVIAKNSSSCYVRSESKLVTALGLSDTIIVATKDATLVAKMSEAHLVKDLVADLKSADRSEAEFPGVVSRPWGTYESLVESEGYQVKRIIVKPGGKLSIQQHKHRAEHWTVVKGVANILNDGEELVLKENESTFIALGSIHGLENQGETSLELIEVQYGSYLGEDDIVRFSDIYGRAGTE